MMRKTVVLTVIAMLAVVAPTWADSIVFFDGVEGSPGEYSGSGSVEGNALAAEAVFSISGTTLTLTLTNTSTEPVRIPRQVLTAVLFTTEAALTPVTAELAGSSSVRLGDAEFVHSEHPNVGGEWTYNEHGISSAGFGLFGAHDRFDTSSNLWGPESPNGLEYGILSQGGIAGSAISPVTTQPLILGSVVFTVETPEGFGLSDIENVRFVYGTDYHHDTPPVPEPTTLVLLGVGVAGLLYRKSARVS